MTSPVTTSTPYRADSSCSGAKGDSYLALTSPRNGLSISELAAYWQFADRSHFIRAFKKAYGRTPGEYARSVDSDDRFSESGSTPASTPGPHGRRIPEPG
ncbi:AraC family transcriptional regulator [Nocardia sp. BMG51109]|uniref:helix-turn-helix domain-containing protein n=1 Tax=Nocardia sp. BMG51109 TaxID=1056816 RepID=UPI0009FFB70C|nr:helix-turn-helix domain-containing protein [Nocardia sp. BMG51109]